MLYLLTSLYFGGFFLRQSMSAFYNSLDFTLLVEVYFLVELNALKES